MAASLSLRIDLYWNDRTKNWLVRATNGQGRLVATRTIDTVARGAFDSADVRALLSSMQSEINSWIC